MKKPEAFNNPIYVTRPLLLPLSEYLPEFEDIWKSGWLTNTGDKHKHLEQQLGAYLGAPHLSLFNNGTIALIVACQAMRLSGEVITTPFTFPATPHVLTWNNITPVFADIHPETLTLDPAAIEPLITARTTGILGVHVYGMPCAIEPIQSIADAYGLKVVYDGAHAFGTTIDNKPLTAFGDVTMLSFHATKLFHTAEGGALVVQDAHVKQRIDQLKNFGIKNEVEVVMAGINGKMNELQAALGLVHLRHVDAEQSQRAILAKTYEDRLTKIEGISRFKMPSNVRNSQQYFVIRVSRNQEPDIRDRLYFELRSFNVFARRYFYPLCSDANCYRALPSASPQKLPVAHRAANEVLALPFYSGLEIDGVNRICDIIEYALHRHR